MTCLAEAGGQHVAGMARAIEELGIRACLARSTMDAGEGLPAKWAVETTETCIKVLDSFRILCVSDIYMGEMLKVIVTCFWVVWLYLNRHLRGPWRKISMISQTTWSPKSIAMMLLRSKRIFLQSLMGAQETAYTSGLVWGRYWMQLITSFIRQRTWLLDTIQVFTW